MERREKLETSSGIELPGDCNPNNCEGKWKVCFFTCAVNPAITFAAAAIAGDFLRPNRPFHVFTFSLSAFFLTIINMSAIILFDGVCNFCNGSVNFIIERDRENYFQFAPLQSATGERLLGEYRIDKTKTDSVILIEDGKVYLYSTAALRVARKLDGAWSWFYVLIIVPKFVRDFFYKLFAKYRYKMFGKQDACMMPTPEIRRRFLT